MKKLLVILLVILLVFSCCSERRYVATTRVEYNAPAGNSVVCRDGYEVTVEMKKRERKRRQPWHVSKTVLDRPWREILEQNIREADSLARISSFKRTADTLPHSRE